MHIGARYRGRVSQECTVTTRKEIPLPSLNSDGRMAWPAKCDGRVFYQNVFYVVGLLPTTIVKSKKQKLV